MKVAIMAGGTGGHIFPGLAVAKELQKQNVEVIWIGAKGGMEENLVKKNDLPIFLLEIQGLRGKGFFGLLKLPFRLFKATYNAMRIFKQEKVNSVLSMGGYVAGPGGLAAKIKKIPLVVHEQNSLFGMTNKYLSKWSTATLTGFNLNQLYNSRHVGNPVREDIENLNTTTKKIEQVTEKNTNILVLGGSLGALSMNQKLPPIFAQLAQNHSISVLHQCGKNKLDDTQVHYQNFKSATVKEFITDMAQAYAEADLVIARAGALTIAEINAVGLPAIFIPYPYAVDDHQTTNAMHLVNNKAALIWQESESEEKLAKQIETLLGNTDELKSMAEQSKSLHIPNAAKTVANICLEVIQ